MCNILKDLIIEAIVNSGPCIKFHIITGVDVQYYKVKSVIHKP